MSNKNKSSKMDNYKKGTLRFSGRFIFSDMVKSPELFYNSDEFRKMKNRNKGRKR